MPDVNTRTKDIIDRKGISNDEIMDIREKLRECCIIILQAHRFMLNDGIVAADLIDIGFLFDTVIES